MDCGVFRLFFKKRNSRCEELTEESNLQTSSTCPTIPGKTESSKDRFENGRRYHNSEDITYILPNDDKENDRVHQQHWLIKHMFGGNYCAPITAELDKGIVVQDAGCGPGTWTLEMATDFPRSTFIGTDVLTRFPEAIKPGNCNFQVHNLAQEGVFPENHFSFIHQRLLLLGILKNDWEKVIREHVRTLAPGGWLECMEPPMFGTEHVGPNHAIIGNAWGTMCRMKGLYSDISDHLEEIFKGAGLVNVEIRRAPMIMNLETQAGRLAWEDIRELFLALKPIIIMANPELAGDEKFAECLQNILKESMESGAHGYFTRVWGQKPLESGEDSSI